ncbi:Plug domain-containing protein, partial [Salinimicrobium sp. CDJ15-91]|nr:Plug domain-containing protein [Salinimicrobium oceani]
KNENLGTLVLSEDTAALAEVSINYKNPSVKREVDRLVFNVENTTLSHGSSWDILKKTPGVILSGENLTVRNQGVQVYINDRKVQLTASELQTLLENYSAENIKSIEVITTPPARYDAEGGAILNIITSKSIAPGYKGNVNAAWTQAIFPKYQLGTSHYYKTEKLNVFGNYS